jgi:hypothetical protein
MEKEREAKLRRLPTATETAANCRSEGGGGGESRAGERGMKVACVRAGSGWGESERDGERERGIGLGT